MRIDKAITPPGLVKGAMCYSLFNTDKGFYMIKTGRGWRLNFNPKGATNKWAANKAVQHLVNKVNETEKNIDENNLDAELEKRQGSFLIAKSDVSDVELKSRYDGLPDLRFKVSGKKYRVQFDQGRETEVEKFVESLK